MKHEVDKWLEDSKRSYALGVLLFDFFAPQPIRNKYIQFFNAVTAPDPFSLEMSMLINKLTDIQRKLMIAPDAFKNLDLNVLKEKIQALRVTPPVDTIDTEDYQDLLDEVELLRDENEELESIIESNDKFVSFEDLPDSIQKLFSELKELRPLMASVHGNLSTCNANDERKALAEELIELDEKRKACWEQIDQWCKEEGVEIAKFEKKAIALEQKDPAHHVLDLTKKIKNTKEAIRRANESIVKFEEEGAVNKAEKAKQRLAEKEVELISLEKEMDELTNV